VLPVTEIAKLIIQMSQTPPEEPVMSANSSNGKSDVETQAVLAVQGDLNAQANGERKGQPSVLTCPECGGVLWEFDNAEVIQYRCHVGHIYSAESMLDEQDGALEAALWTAARTLVENATLARRLARRAKGRGFHGAAERFDRRAREADEHAETVRRVLAQGHTDPELNTAEQSA
jgi:two-component system, chemotaxis family, protein-glutamate methylesterase/glutaminase